MGKKEEIEAFEKEARFYKNFKDNKYIVDMVGFGKDDNNNELLMALEYMDLGSVESLELNDSIKAIKERELIVGYIALNVLSALDELHCNLYVHNDIKPANILSNKHGEIKLSDFGTVLKMDDKYSYLTKINGTERYRSPEKVSTKYNTKSDIWSVGISTFELLFGERKKSNDDTDSNIPLLTPKKYKLSANCCDFMNKCLMQNDKERPSAQQLLKHKWFTQNVKPIPLKQKWPWLVEIDDVKNDEDEEKENKYDN